MTEQKHWPFHPVPEEYESSYSWLRRLAKANNVKTNTFCQKALDLTHQEASMVHKNKAIPDKAIIKLHIGTRQPIETVKNMLPDRLVERLHKATDEWEKRHWEAGTRIFYL